MPPRESLPRITQARCLIKGDSGGVLPALGTSSTAHSPSPPSPPGKGRCAVQVQASFPLLMDWEKQGSGQKLITWEVSSSTQASCQNRWEGQQQGKNVKCVKGIEGVCCTRQREVHRRRQFSSCPERIMTQTDHIMERSRNTGEKRTRTHSKREKRRNRAYTCPKMPPFVTTP